MQPCPTNQMICGFLGNRLPPDEEGRIVKHLLQCSPCRQHVEAVTRSEFNEFSIAAEGAETPPIDESLAMLKQRLYGLGEVEIVHRPIGDPECGDLRGAADTFFLPAHVGRFIIKRKLGAGGFGHVVLAVDPVLNRQVALKYPRNLAVADPAQRSRFLREAKAAANLHHPNIVPVFEAGEADGICYLAGKCVHGPNLAQWLSQQQQPTPPRLAVQLVLALAQAAEYAHRQGVLHRDIKPANVLLDPDGASGDLPYTPKLTDFGLAKVQEDVEMTLSGALMGTPRYMAPEQAAARRDDIGPATDVYALGAVLYELLTTRPPIAGGDNADTLCRVLAEEPISLRRLVATIPRDLEAICLKCLEKKPRRRYAVAGALAADLRRFLSGESTEAQPLSQRRKTLRWLARRPTLILLTAAMLVSFAAAFAGDRWYSRRLNESIETSRQAVHHRDELDNAVKLRSAWQAFNSDHVLQARSILESMADKPAAGSRDFAWNLLRKLTQNSDSLALSGHSGDVYHVVFSPDGKLLATASQDQTLRIWNAATGKLQAILTGHAGEVNAVAWSPDGMLLISASDDGTVRLWNPQEGRPLDTTLRFDHGPVVSLAFSDDGALVVSGDDRGRITFTATADWQTKRTMETGGGRVDGLALSRDGAWLATATDQRGVQVWSLSTDQPPRTSPHMPHYGRAVLFGRDNRLLACGYTWAYLWDWLGGKEPQAVSRQTDYVNSIAFCDNNRLVAIGGPDEIVRVYDAESGELRQRLIGHSDRVWCVAVSPDGSRLATASADDTVRLWSLDAGHSVLAVQHPAPLLQVAFAADGQTLIASRDNGAVNLWRLHCTETAGLPANWQLKEMAGPLTGDPAAGEIVPSRGGFLRPFRDLAISPDERSLAEASGSSVRLWNLTTRKIERTLPTDRTVWTVHFSPDGRRLAAAFGDQIELWDTASGKSLARWQAHQSRVNAVRFSSTGLLASSSQDRLVRLWDGTTGEPLATYSGHTATVEALCFSPDGRLIVSGGHDHAVKFWSVASREELCTLRDFPTAVRGLAFNPAGTVLAAVGGHDAQSGHLRLWLASGEGDRTLVQLDAPLDAPAATPPPSGKSDDSSDP